MRVLLLAYPARLRRRHGSELIMTMAEVAGPAGPTAADRRHLLLDGLKERFRLPPVRLWARIAAVLAVLIGGALGAAAGSWAGMWTYTPVPDARHVIGPEATPDPDPLQWRLAASTLARITPGVDATDAAGRVRERLVGTGWSATPVVVSGGTDGIHFRRAAFDAERSGVRFAVNAYYSEDRLLEIDGWSLRPAAYVPLVLAGMALGLLAGRLIAAALTYRIAGSLRRGRAGALIGAAGLGMLLVPAGLIYSFLFRYLPDGSQQYAGEFVHRGLRAGPPSLAVYLLIGGLALTAVAAIVARPGRSHPEPPDLRVA